MVDIAWTSRDVRLFLIEDKWETLLQDIYIPYIDFFPRKDNQPWVCKHCGSYIEEELKCMNCNAPKSRDTQSALVTLEGYLPRALVLDNLEKGFCLHVTHCRCGDPANYSGQTPIIGFSNCSVRKKYVDGVSFLNSMEDRALVLTLVIACNAQFLIGREP